ncbi:hypothetical protein ASPZODRAFT_14668 [Penicilliopsis zonata CBS 506.65]|uniref:Uncharacterized protein n=1 Tax=Penicilliopsis zonata CBS 506.65 TaxID=1073090 RepID=A0A1L9SNB8_9EURO|nr:hypothetical protein ASPZODRAFT_14668 [Penicilliopsis zonata CBS 506.65]OJJ48537.1 hypothetical protein ASPZODRAFT_14668 [Penicilliopsis zonata CBS 506.65]
MAFTPIQAPSSQKPALGSRDVAIHNMIRDQFTVSTWLLLGAGLQGLLALILPARYALLPAVTILALRSIDTLLQTCGITKDRAAEGVIRGKFSAQIPDREGNIPLEPAEQEIVLLHLATRSNHPLGMMAPGYKEVIDYMGKLLADLDRNSHENGYLGSTGWIPFTERKTSNQIMAAVYFRSYKDLHDFAHGAMHLETWTWFTSISRRYPHLSIMHETYVAPKGHHENIYVNNHRTGLAATSVKVPIKPIHPGTNGTEQGLFRWISPVVDAGRGVLKSSRGRLGAADGSDNEAYKMKDY